MIKKLLTLLFFICFSTHSFAAVILQYHHVGTSTPRSTSVTPEELRAHLDWLQKNNFELIALPALVSLIQHKQLTEQQKIASITFDDVSQSLCSEAWPILKAYQIPFTIFVNTEMLPTTLQEKANSNTNCAWAELKEMLNSGLLTVGNHSHTHPSMLDNETSFSKRSENKNEILLAQQRIDTALGQQAKLFAYPYGEYSEKTQKLISSLNYIGFGQQSGAIGNNSDLSALPRFPMSGQYANIDTIADKLLSLPFPQKNIHVSGNPIKGKNPHLAMHFYENFPNKIQCFLGNGETITTEQQNKVVTAYYQGELKAGRVRYNCTAPSNQAGRFYWFSYQWLYQE